MHFIWWILIVIFSFIGLVGIAGIINPNFFNKDLKEGKQPFTRKLGITTFIISLILIILLSSLVTPHKDGNKIKNINASKPVSKAVEAVKHVKPAAKTVNNEPVKNKNVNTIVNPVSDQYLKDFLVFMDQLNSDLQLAVQQDPNPTNVAKIITNGNVEGWKRFDKVNTPPSKESDEQFNKRYDVLMAWHSLYDLDMDYNSYIMHDSNVDLKTINEKEKVFLNDLEKAKSHFNNKSN